MASYSRETRRSSQGKLVEMREKERERQVLKFEQLRLPVELDLVFIGEPEMDSMILPCVGTEKGQMTSLECILRAYLVL